MGEAERHSTVRALEAVEGILARWEVERDRSPLDRVAAAGFRSRRSLNSGERRWAAEAVYGTVRFLRRQQALCEQLGLRATSESLARLWAYAPVRPDGISDVVAPRLPEAFRPVPPDALEAALAALPSPDAPHTYLRSTLAFPDAMADEMEALLGGEAVPAAIALNTQAPVTLRRNPLRATEAQMAGALPEASPTRWSPWGWELPHRVNVSDLPGFREGWFEVQEEASQLAALLTDAQPGQTVVDVGAGAGGKTLAIAALMHNEGRLFALEPLPARLEELEKRSKRAGARNIRTVALPADANGLWQPPGHLLRTMKKLHGAADVVLLDAPCTGSGVLRRSPDAKWRANDLAAFTRLQDVLMTQSAELVAPNGVLIYVTCAFERCQNEDRITAFLASDAGCSFRPEPASPRLAAACRRAARDTQGKEEEEARFAPLMDGPRFRTWPHRQGLDGFFAACLRRKEE